VSRLVLDTNILVSAFLRPGPPATIYRAIGDGRHTLLWCAAAETELLRVLRYPHIGFSPEQAAGLVADVRRRVEWVTPGVLPADAVPADPADAVFLALARDGRADYLVSGDRHLLAVGVFQNVRILRPAEFLALPT
jgi:putative PIN family toxin of toxin-antitoxin system